MRRRGRRDTFRAGEKGIGPVLSVLATQLVDIIPILQALEDKSRVVIAYEPVWAIGTGKVCPCDVAQQVHKTIRDYLAELYDRQTADAVRIQYGGSVTPESVDELMAQPDIDGCLVGGASLVAEKFARICNFVRK